jgi:hypothetical protein
MGAAQKVALEQTTRALGGAAFLHNVIMGQLEFSIEKWVLFMLYNATLCN